ncbi:SRPBCC domain-containing protein [Microbacterium lacus]|uniref:SRPBCC family protein n=1 Tax=Microbacterium lacus TaxID=415217 RepID=UPI00384D0099
MTEYFTITRELAAPRALVFETLTRPEHFAVWFGTAAVEVPQDSLTMDVRPGGDFRAVMLLPDGNRINWSGEYIAVDPPSHLAMTLSDQPGDDAGLPVLFDLEETDTGTRLTIRQDRADFSDEQVEMTIEGYNAFIDDIANLLTRLQSDASA